MHTLSKIEVMREQLIPVLEDMVFEEQRTPDTIDDYEVRLKRALPRGCELKQLNRKTLKVTVVVDYKLVELLPTTFALQMRVLAMA